VTDLAEFDDLVCPDWNWFKDFRRIICRFALRNEGFLVVQRLSMPAVLPGICGVIAARRCALVMPWCR
jgi:hypothetical protein